MRHNCDGCGRPLSKCGYLRKVSVGVPAFNDVYKHLCKRCRQPYVAKGR